MWVLLYLYEELLRVTVRAQQYNIYYNCITTKLVTGMFY